MDRLSRNVSSPKSLYRSCFFLDGVPILPPLMTAHRCTEVLYYKQLAIAVEERIRILKENQEMVQHDDDIFPKTQDELAVKTPPILNNNSTFDPLQEIGTSKEGTNITRNYNSVSDQETMPVNYKKNISKKKVEPLNKMPSPQSKNKAQNIKLLSSSSPTRNFIRKNSYTIINNNEHNQNFNSKNQNHKESNRTIDQMKPSKDQSLVLASVSSTPSLTRSNSYTLEEPSAFLKAQLQSQGIYVSDNSINIERSPKSARRKGWDLETAKVLWTPQSSRRSSSTLSDTNKKRSQLSKLTAASPKKPTNKNNNQNVSKTNASCNQTNKSKSVRNQSPFRNQKPNSNIQKSITMSLNCLNTYGNKAVSPCSSMSHVKDETVHNTTPTSTPKEYTTQSRRTTPDRRSNASDSKSTSIARVFQDSEYSEKDNNDISSDAQDNIRMLFTKLQEEHSKQMEELLRQQKIDQENLQKAFEHQQNLLLQEIKKSYTLSNISSNVDKKTLLSDDVPINDEQKQVYVENQENFVEKETSTFIKQSENVLTESQILLNRANTSIDSYLETRSVTTSLSNNNNTLMRSCSASTNATVQLSEYGISCTESEMYNIDSDSTQYIEHIDTDLILGLKNDEVAMKPDQECYLNRYKDVYPSSRPSSPPQIERRIEKLAIKLKKNSNDDTQEVLNVSNYEWSRKHRAASTINAGVRGYLVRRLMKTQNIQAIKQTIQETLLCALQLHRDSTGQVKLSDVELHRRLIEQLNSACFNLHDVFFNMTTQQRLQIIAADRERLVGKLAMSNPTVRIKSSSNTNNSKYSNYVDAFISKTRSHSLDLMDPINLDMMDNLKSHKYRSEHSYRGSDINTPRRPWR